MGIRRKLSFFHYSHSTVGVGCLLLLLFSPTTMTARESSTVNPVRSTTENPESATDTRPTLPSPVTTRVETTVGTEPTTLSAATEANMENNEECRVPAYASINYETVFSTPVTNDSLLVVEGQCYLACMESLSDPGVGFGHFRERQVGFSPWPYYTLVESSSCDPHEYVHECTRGCVIATQTEKDCTNTCHSECLSDCGIMGCSNPASDEWWVRENCPLNCVHPRCALGCGLSSMIESCIGPECGPPLAPEAPPTLTPVFNSTRAGVYTIDLTHTVPSSPLLSHNVVFLFEIQDNTTGNYSYYWVVDPMTSTLDLADFSCREVTVRFAVANQKGLSGFSESFGMLQVYGDPTRIPFAVTNIRHMEEDDTREGYFGHVVWTITWDPPQSSLHLVGYILNVYSPDQAEFRHCGSGVYTISSRENSVTVNASQPGEVLLMGCEYAVEVHSLGLDGNKNTSISISSRIFSSRPRSFIRDLSCNKIWDTMNYKFSFNFTWSLPLYFAVEDPIAYYNISVDLINVADPSNVIESRQTVLSHNTFNTNETSFYYYLPHENDDFFKPYTDNNRRFRLRLFYVYNESNIRFPLMEITMDGPVTCMTDAISPSPSPVQDLSLLSPPEQLSEMEIAMNFSWLPPANPNGRLERYYVCLSRRPLKSTEEPSTLNGRTSCEFINGTETEVSMTIRFFHEEGSYCLYLQIRARNEYVFGNWTEPVVVSYGKEGSCTEPTVSTPVSQPVVEQSTLSPVLKIGVPVIIFTLITVLCVCILAIFLCACLRRRRKYRLHEPPSDIDPMFMGSLKHPASFQPAVNPQLPEIDEWEIPPTEVIMEDCLGEGAFGEVYKGVVKGPIKCNRVMPSLRNAIAVPVAVKVLKVSAIGSERKDFLSEIDMMKMISEGHNPNVIGLVGCVTIQEPLSLILEFVPFGDLLFYLRTNMKLNASQEMESQGTFILEQLGKIELVDLVKFPYQIASGMEHLSSMGIVHRDLACRNILVDERKVLKITDFGMSREVDEIYVQQSKGRVPIKWMALESILTRQFTTASDVWSYGITLWEIGTMGGFPYPSVSNEELLLLLKDGYRMEKPENCSPEIYDIMCSCWDGDPRKRPTFTELRSKFDKMLEKNAENIYFLPVNSDNPRYNPENAPQGMTISVPPVQTLLSPNPAQNRMSLSAFREAYANEFTSNHLSIRPGNHSGRSSAQTSPGQRSQRSVSPSYNPFPRDNTLNTATGTASVYLSRDISHRKTGNLYVKDPSEQLLGVTTQARPTSMLVTSPSTDALSSINNLTSQENGHRHRPSSMIIAPNNEAAHNRNESVSQLAGSAVANGVSGTCTDHVLS